MLKWSVFITMNKIIWGFIEHGMFYLNLSNAQIANVCIFIELVQVFRRPGVMEPK